MSTFLVSGACGFIGSHYVRYLLKDGHRVLGIDNFITGSRENLNGLNHDSFSFFEHDISKPFETSEPIHYIVHLASIASPVYYLKYPMETLRVGCYGTENILNLALEKDAICFLASTSEVYGDPLMHPQVESYWGNVNPIGLRSPYDESKRFMETLATVYYREYKAKIRIGRIFNTYGERMSLDDGRVVPNFVSQALSNKPITVYGDGKQTRSFCYVSDLIQGIDRLIRSDYTSPVNLGNPDEYTISEFAQLAIKLTGSTSSIVFKELPQDDPKVRCPAIELAMKILGWKPTTSLEEGMKKTIPWFKEHLEKKSDPN